MTDLSWYALFLGDAQAEFAASNAIKRIGLESFVPCEFKWKLRNPRTKLKKRVKYPLCIRYGFVGFPRGARWPDLLTEHPYTRGQVIRGTTIYASPVGTSPLKPTQLTQEQIDHLAALCDSSVPYKGAINPHRANLEVQVGQTAKILSPAFYGLYGRVDEVTVHKAKVVIEMLGSFRPVEVPIAELEAA